MFYDAKRFKFDGLKRFYSGSTSFKFKLMFFSIMSQQVAKMIGADAKEIVFTSGATESNNIAVKGVARFYSTNKKHVITTQTEHKCVLDSCRQLEAEGFDVTYLPVQQNGIINLEVIVFHLFVRGV